MTDVSIIIPTYNGAHKLPLLLEKLKQQTYQDFEVLVVVDGSTDDTLQVLENLPFKLSRFKVLVQKNKGRSAVRNYGAVTAMGDLLIFFDDDMLPLEECIERHVQHHQRFPGSILTGGLKECAAEQSEEILQYRSFLSERWIKPLRAQEEQQLKRENIFITAANFSVPRQVFEKIGGFDETLNDAEDFDLAVRAYKSGIPLYFNYNAFAWHNDRVTYASYIRRQRQYNKAHRVLIKDKPWLQKEGFIMANNTPNGLRKIVFGFFSTSFWVNAAESGSLKILPKKLRYKLYDLIITANGTYFPDKVKL